MNTPAPRAYSTAEIAAAMEVTTRAVQLRAKTEDWQPAETTPVRRFALGALPPDVRGSVAVREVAKEEAAAAGFDDDRMAILKDAYDYATPHARTEAQRRVAALAEVERLHREGMGMTAARKRVAAEWQAKGEKCSLGSLKGWARKVRKAPRAVKLPLLLPAAPRGRDRAAIHPELWAWLKHDYLRREAPNVSTSYMRTARIAKKRGWAIPSEATVRRRLAEIPRDVRILLRQGAEAWGKTQPAMQRDRTCFAVGEAVNGDGWKADMFAVKFGKKRPIRTATFWVWQDIRSSKILAWELAETECTDLFRRATYKLSKVCNPEYIWLDNTTAAANKTMTSGARNRHRFKDMPDDGKGLLQVALAAIVCFTNPDKVFGNPGAKPIERSFGIGGIGELMRTHPDLAGRGRSMKDPITAEELCATFDKVVTEFNSRPNRRGQNIRRGSGNSFNDEWNEGCKRQAPLQASTRAQEMFLMDREIRTVTRKGEIRLKCGRGPNGEFNVYYSDETYQHAGQKVMVFFDPEDLSKDVQVRSLDGAFICMAQHAPSHAFNDKSAAREYAKYKRQAKTATDKRVKAEGDKSAVEHAARYGNSQPDDGAADQWAKGPTRIAPDAISNTPPESAGEQGEATNAENTGSETARADSVLEETRAWWAKHKAEAPDESWP